MPSVERETGVFGGETRKIRVRLVGQGAQPDKASNLLDAINVKFTRGAHDGKRVLELASQMRSS